jgi:hypothetical protein
VAGKVGFPALLTSLGIATLRTMRTVLIVVFDGVQSLDLTGPP